MLDSDSGFLPIRLVENSTVMPCAAEFRRGKTGPNDGNVQQTVKQVMYPDQLARTEIERRRDHRRPYPYPFRITPFEGQPVREKSLIVIGKTLSERGVDFYHREMLPYRQVVASFETNNGGIVHLLLDLTWCRFGKHAIYDSGGRFLRVLVNLD